MREALTTLAGVVAEAAGLVHRIRRQFNTKA